MPGGALHAALSPDAAHLAVTGPLGYCLWHLATGREVLRKSGRWSSRARWAAPDRLAIADGRTAVVLDHTGRELWRTAAAPSTVTDLAWTRDGRRQGFFCSLVPRILMLVRCLELEDCLEDMSLSCVGVHAVAAEPDGDERALSLVGQATTAGPRVARAHPPDQEHDVV
ncbi:hypothetical protein ACTWPT_16785 [Nonomuraea sp. 3N208]|uniref:hypothetical protein n=1 Tax=Nonomuraea sp. 3N208 TaxID=3457421 RepID=UPI003FCC81D0